MKHWQIFYLFVLISLTGIVLTACDSDSNDVPSLAATPTPGEADEILDIETKMMAFTECLRNEGLEVLDPVVDSDGNIQIRTEFTDYFVQSHQFHLEYIPSERVQH